MNIKKEHRGTHNKIGNLMYVLYVEDNIGYSEIRIKKEYKKLNGIDDE